MRSHSCPRFPGGLFPGACKSADAHIMQNIPSRKDHQKFFFVDHATNMCWVFLLKTRVSKHILAHLTTFVNKVLTSLIIRLRVAAEVLGFLHRSGSLV